MTPTCPNLRHITAAVEIDRLGSISAAARSVHLSQSAVTQGLTKLEHQLQTPIFSRTSTGLFATEHGRIFLNRAQRAINWIRASEPLVASRSSNSRNLQRLLTVPQLRALIAVVETGSYTRAAQTLDLSQPTVHRAVREVESICQQDFFRRSPVGVEPIWQARQLARHARLFFAEIAQAVDELSELRGVMSGNLAVGSLPLARTQMVPHCVTRLLNEYPDVRVQIIDGPYEEQLHALLHGQIDVIVGALRYPQPSPDVIQELLFEDHLNVVVRPEHRLANSQQITAEELAQLDWIAPRENTPGREAFSNFFRRAGLEPPEHVIECSSLMAIRGLLLDSNRAALLPAKQVEIDVRSGLLAMNPRSLAGTSRDIGLALRKDWQPTRVQARFIELLRENRKV